jgi:cytochrome c biogenesis protein CcdA
MGGRLGIAFAAGFVSVVLPCVLPLVPGYLAALSSVEAGQLGQRGTARRVVVSSIPFILGFTVVFVVLGAGAAAIGGAVTASAQAEVAGFVLVVLGLAFVGLLPVPERVLMPGLLTGARRRGSGALLGGAFAVCAAPCIGTVLAAVLVLAGIEIVTGDASITDAYAGAVPADLVLVCGVFGNISEADIQRTASSVPMLAAPGATVMWTRHRGDPDVTPSIRGWFRDAGCSEIAFDHVPDSPASVGVARFEGTPAPLVDQKRLPTRDAVTWNGWGRRCHAVFSRRLLFQKHLE